MEYKCLSRDEYHSLIHHQFHGVALDEGLVEVMDRARYNWDINIVGVNYFLSIIIEQLMKKGNVNNEFIEKIYAFSDNMSFIIDELDHNFIDELFTNNLPEKRNECASLIYEAKKGNNILQVQKIEQSLGRSFEEDLLRVVECYYESEIYH